jgi:hypothetical protein
LIYCFVTIIRLIGDRYVTREELGCERIRTKDAKAVVTDLKLDADLARKQVIPV